MSITIKLSNIIDELDMMSSERQSYLNIKTGDIVTISDYLGSEEDADNIEKIRMILHFYLLSMI